MTASGSNVAVPISKLLDVLYEAFLWLPPTQSGDDLRLDGWTTSLRGWRASRHEPVIILPRSTVLSLKDPSALRSMTLCGIEMGTELKFVGCEDAELTVSMPAGDAKVSVAQKACMVRRWGRWRTVP